MIISIPDSLLHQISRNTCCCCFYFHVLFYLLYYLHTPVSEIYRSQQRPHFGSVSPSLPYQPSIVNSFSPRWGSHNPILIIDVTGMILCGLMKVTRAAVQELPQPHGAQKTAFCSTLSSSLYLMFILPVC